MKNVEIRIPIVDMWKNNFNWTKIYDSYDKYEDRVIVVDNILKKVSDFV